MALAPAEVGERIKDARTRKGWTQLDFALEADVSPSTVTRWEAGKLPPLRELFRIAELLGVEVDQLVEPAEAEPDIRLEVVEAHLEKIVSALELLTERVEHLDERLEPRPASRRR